jgi:hypothetical protein
VKTPALNIILIISPVAGLLWLLYAVVLVRHPFNNATPLKAFAIAIFLLIILWFVRKLIPAKQPTRHKPHLELVEKGYSVDIYVPVAFDKMRGEHRLRFNLPLPRVEEILDDLILQMKERGEL